MARIFIGLCLHYLLLATSTFVIVQSQKPQIPAELQRLYNTDLETWVAPKEFLKDFPYYLSGFDEEDHPIWVLEFGRWDIRTTVERGPKSQAKFDKYVDQAVMIIYNSSIPDDGINPVIGIVDFEGYNLRQLSSAKTLEYIIQKLRLILIALTNLQSAYFINVNFFAEKILNLVRPVLGKEFAKPSMAVSKNIYVYQIPPENLGLFAVR
ncbi:unnamed protein product [Allacma fusca]|uniref:CRAL-TRIO domain-containing protein n=1 Tax=Allacma fusca TaxID=39272 RepID=A0A8J2NRW8_9HEXA|nr:unnamed protein product [Allacma fusca]